MEPSRTAPPTLVLTGERTLPGIPDERYWFQRHVVAYAHAADHVQGRRGSSEDVEVVLDAGCGEGYGLAMLAAAGADRVIGAELDPTVVAHARATYAAADPRIEVLEAELLHLPLDDDTVDLTVSFQVIEHLHDIPGYLQSLRRVTRPAGTVVIATPNRLTFTPGSDVPVNPFHTREFTAAELRDELTAADLEVEDLLAVHHGPQLVAAEARFGRLQDVLADPAGPDAWPGELRALVHRVEPSWFVLDADPDHLDVGLDLLAVCRVPADA